MNQKTIDFTHLATYRPFRGFGDILLPRRSTIWERVAAALGLSPGVTYSYLGGYPGGTNTGSPSTPSAVGVAEIILDFAAIALARTAAGQTALAATNVLELFSVPAGTWVPYGAAECLTVEGETATLDLGDGASAAGYLDDFNCNSAAGLVGSHATTALSVAVGGGKTYATADTIDALLNTAAFNVGKVRLVALMVDLRRSRS